MYIYVNIYIYRERERCHKSQKGIHIQLFCTNLEPKTKKGQSVDLSRLTALQKTAPVRDSSLTLACETNCALTLRVIRLQSSGACWVANCLTPRKRHPLTLRHQSKTLSVTIATCNLPEILWATPKAHLTPRPGHEKSHED